MAEKIRYDKLVRDRIPDIIKERGDVPVFRAAADDAEFRRRLFAKLQEEVNEFLVNPNQEELADILEVINSIHELDGFDAAEVHAIKNKKARERGSFQERIILEEA